MTEEAVVAVPAGAGEVRPDRGMREACAAEGRTAGMGEARAAHPADMQAASEMATTTEMPAAEAAMPAACEHG